MERDHKSILWINYLKAISIIAVYFVHSQLYYGYMLDSWNIFIYPFYVNAFFFISGYLLFRKQLSVHGSVKKMIGNILFRLVFPSILFAIIEFFPAHILRNSDFDLQLFFVKTVGGCTYWFTSALTVAQMLIALMLLSRVKKMGFYLLLCCLLYLLGISLTLIAPLPDVTMSFPWQYRHGLYCILFLALGGLYWRYEASIVKYFNKYTIFLLMTLYIMALVLHPTHFHVLVSMQDVNVAGVIVSVVGTIVLIEICKWIPKGRLLNYIGKNTIGFYFMSGALPTVVGMGMHHILSQNSLLGLVVVFLTSTTIALCATYFINRFLPWLFDIRQIATANKKMGTHASHASHV